MSSSASLEGDERLRLFLALVLPDAVSRSLVAWGREHLGRGRPLEHLHVTLAFLGSRPRSELAGIVGALRDEAAATQPFTLEVARYRETRSVGMLVLDDPTGGATGLAERLHARLEELGTYQLGTYQLGTHQLGSYRREARPWLPHVTVLRFRERPRLDPPVASLREEVGAFAPSEAAAFLSRLHPSGAQYETLERCRLSQKQG